MNGLGRRIAPDIRDRSYPMRGRLMAAPAPTRSWRYWAPGMVLDQGQTSMCVGFAWEQWLQASPLRTTNGPTAPAIYDAAQLVDEFPDTPPAGGTSVRAGAKVMAADGRLGEYVWASSTREIRDWLLTRGPVVLGTDWYDAMFTPDAKGFVAIGGNVAGGHAYLCTGYKPGAFRFVQSWGVSWGQRGRFWMTEATLAQLLANAGEACAGAEVRP